LWTGRGYRGHVFRKKALKKLKAKPKSACEGKKGEEIKPIYVFFGATQLLARSTVLDAGCPSSVVLPLASFGRWSVREVALLIGHRPAR
jgi:hypothetical protein